MNFEHSKRAQDYINRVREFVQHRIIPAEPEYYDHLARPSQLWTQPPVMESCKAAAKSEGLWNLFLPEPEFGPGLSTLEYASLAEAMGHSFIAPEVFNCNAPDTGNMEGLRRYGSPAQQQR